MAKSKNDDIPGTITEDDLRNKFQAVQDQLQGKVEDQKSTIAATVAGVGVVLAIVFFLLGKRAGRKKSTIVEIRRV
ncbi:MAG: hypothetical protein QNM02_20810 [Acidimicrobiia bacterium]|nr:hypothetical protein [Acidimicrobiia bacterium]